MLNAKIAQKILARAIEHLPVERTCECARALASALITSADIVPAATKAKLAPIIRKYVR